MEPVLFLDREPINTRLTFRHDENNFMEEFTMTIRELAENIIIHSDDVSSLSEIDTDRAAELISWLDPDSGLPEDLTPESFAVAWNEIIQEGSYGNDD